MQNDFYYDILNVGKNNDINFITNEIINIKKYIEDKSITDYRMCKVLSNLVFNDLKEKNISCNIYNTKDLFDCYEHEFVIVHYKEEKEIKHILIDMAYSQFLNTNNKMINDKLKFFPGDYLKGTTILYNLLNKGFTKIDENDFQEYLYSIHQDKKNICRISLKDFNINSNKRKA